MLTRGMALYVSHRLALILFTAVAVSSLVFLGVHRIPGDALLNERHPDPARVAALLHYYKLDLPLFDQYRIFVGNLVFHGDLGESMVYRGTKLTPLLLREASVSGEVGLLALVFTVGLGIMLGVFAAIRQNTWVDYLLSTISVIGYSIPNFVLATIGVLVFSKYLFIWTSGAVYVPEGWTGTYGLLSQLPVPAFALGFPYASIVARLTRASMLEVIRQDYVRTARAKGLPGPVVVVRHALRNALLPVITILGPLSVGILTGGVVIENIFNIPGLGKEFVSSIISRDYNVVIGVFTVYAILIGVANLAVDLLYAVIDPRIRY